MMRLGKTRRIELGALCVAVCACSSGGSGTGGSAGSGSGGGAGTLGASGAGGASGHGGGGGGSHGSGASGSGSSGSHGAGGSKGTAGGSDAGNGAGTDAGSPTNTGRICPMVAAGDHESYGLPATKSLPAGVSAMTNWTMNPAAGGWNGSQIVDACRYEVDPDGFKTQHGFPAVRVEVDPGDDPLDLGEGTERAEDLDFQTAAGTVINENDSSGTQYFATSYFFPKTWAGTQLSGDGNSWSIVLQLHGPDSVGASPAFSLSAAKSTASGPEVYGIGTNVGAITSGCCGPSYTMKDDSIRLGIWTDFVILMTFASTPTGHLTVWRRDQGQSGFTQEVDVPNVATLQYTSGQPVGDHYWKQGLYRGGVMRTDVYWLGRIVRGSSFAAVEEAAFGTSDGP
jgi:hypothetical protein